MVINVQGMTCAHCERAVKEAVEAIAPASQVSVDLKQGTVSLPDGPSQTAVEAAIRDAGYQVA